MVAVELAAESRRRCPAYPGLPDEAFEHDGQLTKAEVRAVTLAALAPLDGELLWDVGAGAGSVAIEWLRAGRGMRRGRDRARRDAGRPDRGQRRAAGRAGAGRCTLARRPALSPGCRQPDAIFVGGGIGRAGLARPLLERLRPGGRLVANAVTIAGEAALLAFHADAWRQAAAAGARPRPR